MAEHPPLKYAEVTDRVGKLYFHHIKKLSVSPELASIAAAFRRNMDRVEGLATLPLFVIGSVMSVERAWARVCFEKVGRPWLNPGEEHLADEIGEECLGLFKEFTNEDAPQSFQYVESMADFGGRPRAALDAILAAMILGAWTAFESLTGDLWAKLIDLRPMLAYRVIGAEVLPGDKEADVERRRKKKFEIPAWLAEEVGLNFSENMGKLLAASKNWEFSRRTDIRDAYLTTLPNEEQQLKPILDDPRLRWLASARNVLAHQAGIVDRPFKKTVGDHPTFKDAQPGKPIPIDGIIVGELAAGAVECGVALLRFADGWLAANPKP